MLKLFSLLARLLSIANYGLGSLAFVYYVNKHDTGQWNSDGWEFFFMGGVISGILALVVDTHLYRKFNLRSQSLFSFITRQMVFGVLFMTVAVAVGSLISLVVSSVSTSDIESLALILVIPFFVMIFLLPIVPLGAVTGLINGFLFGGIHILQTRDRQLVDS